MRAVCEIETLPNGKGVITVKELPYMVFRSRVIENIADLYPVSGRNSLGCGGIAQKDEMAMQIYADVTGRDLHIAGTVQAAALGERWGLTPAGTGARIAALTAAFGLPESIPCTAEQYDAAVGLDKKGTGADITLILLEKLGKAVPHKMPNAQLLEELK